MLDWIAGGHLTYGLSVRRTIASEYRSIEECSEFVEALPAAAAGTRARTYARMLAHMPTRPPARPPVAVHTGVYTKIWRDVTPVISRLTDAVEGTGEWHVCRHGRQAGAARLVGAQRCATCPCTCLSAHLCISAYPRLHMCARTHTPLTPTPTHTHTVPSTHDEVSVLHEIVHLLGIAHAAAARALGACDAAVGEWRPIGGGGTDDVSADNELSSGLAALQIGGKYAILVFKAGITEMFGLVVLQISDGCEPVKDGVAFILDFRQ